MLDTLSELLYALNEVQKVFPQCGVVGSLAECRTVHIEGAAAEVATVERRHGKERLSRVIVAGTLDGRSWTADAAVLVGDA
jgi:hypothetical protein